MKLKLKKYKIASFQISHKLFGGETYTTGSDRHTNLPTMAAACMETYNEACTYSLVPTKCDTNDGTAQTWDPTGVGGDGDGSQTDRHC